MIGYAICVAMGLTMAAAPAFAQSRLSDMSDAQRQELYCVSDAIAGNDGDFAMIAATYLDGAKDGQATEAAAAALGRHRAACAAKYDWDETHQELAGTVGMHGAVIERVTDDLAADGVDEKKVDMIFAALDTLQDDVIGVLIEGTWVTNKGVQDRIREALAAEGYPSAPDAVENAIILMESTVLEATATSYWIALLP